MITTSAAGAETLSRKISLELTTDFTNFAVAQSPGPAKALAASLGLPRTASDWQTAGIRSGLWLGMLGMMLMLVTHHRSRVVYAAIVVTVILSMVVTPLLNSLQAAVFMDEQAAKQAAIEQEQDEQARYAEAQAEQAAGVVKGIASVFGLSGAIKQASEAAQRVAGSGEPLAAIGSIDIVLGEIDR